MKNRLYLLLFLLVVFTKCASDKITLEERDGFIEYVLDIQKQVSEELDIEVLFSKDPLGNQTARFMLSGRDQQAAGWGHWVTLLKRDSGELSIQ